MRFEDAYDEPTLRAIDRTACARRPTIGGWRGAVVAGALHAAVSGTREVFDPAPPPPDVVEVSPEPRPDPSARVRLLFVPHAPTATRAYVRL
jgi:hypothetical protein